MFKKFGIPALLAGVFLALSPSPVLAAEHGHGGHAHGEMHGHGLRGEHHGLRGGHNGFRGERHERWEHGHERGHFDHGHVYGDYYWGGPGYSFGFYGAPGLYGYEPGYYSNPDQFYGPYPCYPGGYYDQYGNWIATPGCAAPPPYGY